MDNFYDVAEEVFNILKSFGQGIILYDNSGNRVYQPGEARKFFVTAVNIMVTLDDKGEDSEIKLMIGDNLKLSSIRGLHKMLRDLASSYNLLMGIKRYNGTITPKNYTKEINESSNFTSNNTMFITLFGENMKKDKQLDEAALPQSMLTWLSQFDTSKIGAMSESSYEEVEQEENAFNSWKEEVLSRYPNVANKIKFRGVTERGKHVISAEIDGEDRSYGVFDLDTYTGEVLGESASSDELENTVELEDPSELEPKAILDDEEEDDGTINTVDLNLWIYENHPESYQLWYNEVVGSTDIDYIVELTNNLLDEVGADFTISSLEIGEDLEYIWFLNEETKEDLGYIPTDVNKDFKRDVAVEPEEFDEY